MNLEVCQIAKGLLVESHNAELFDVTPFRSGLVYATTSSF